MVYGFCHVANNICCVLSSSSSYNVHSICPKGPRHRCFVPGCDPEIGKGMCATYYQVRGRFQAQFLKFIGKMISKVF